MTFKTVVVYRNDFETPKEVDAEITALWEEEWHCLGNGSFLLYTPEQYPELKATHAHIKEKYEEALKNSTPFYITYSW